MSGLPEGVPRPPYYETLGIEITTVESGYVEGRLPVGPSVSAVPDEPLAHGGAIASLADSVGYWAASSINGFATTPTVDLRVDYLKPATDDLSAEATVTRNGESVGTVDIEVKTDDGIVATARGVFKTGGGSPDSAWSAFEE